MFLQKSILATAIIAFSSISLADFAGRPDIKLKASYSSSAPSTPNCFKQLGYWDVDSGGGYGTDGSFGKFMMGLYVIDETKLHTVEGCDPSSVTYIEDIILIASERSNVDPLWQSQYGLWGYQLIGYWDVDKGGSYGSFGTSGANKTFMYVKPYIEGESTNKIIDIQLRVHNGYSSPDAPGNGYERVGYWDVDGGRGDTLSRGTDGSMGHNKMALFVDFE